MDLYKSSQSFKSQQGQQTMIVSIQESQAAKAKPSQEQPVPSKKDPYYE